jgi:hypothetical protein
MKENKIDVARQKLKQLLKPEYHDYIDSTLAGDFAAALVYEMDHKQDLVAVNKFINTQGSCHVMTLRDYIAAKAVQGIISARDMQFVISSSEFQYCKENVAISAYEIADEMLKARER